MTLAAFKSDHDQGLAVDGGLRVALALHANDDLVDAEDVERIRVQPDTLCRVR
ncbi:MAG: hypothetical protein HY040_07030 [Planctomycetes bacterium]|nr:hypothetical protein [Planctomycetota bacterium]